MNRKTRRVIPFLALFTLLPLLILYPQTSSGGEDREGIFAPFVSRFKAEAKGSSILITWKDSRNLENPRYRIYTSELPFNGETLETAALLDTVESGVEQYLYEPEDGIERYFLVLAVENERLYDLFIPYRNMSVTPTSAVLYAVEEEKATILSGLEVIPDLQQMLIRGASSRADRPVILFRSTELPRKRADLNRAARVTTLTGSFLQWKDRVVPGIPFYYALVDQDLFESGSEAVLYEGSVTQEPVEIPLEEWSPAQAHTFQFFSRHIPLPVLNISNDIESGLPLPGPALPDSPVELTGDTALALAALNFGKSVRSVDWMETDILRVDRVEPLHPATQGIPLLLENRDWDAVVSRTTREMESLFDQEIRARLHYYRGQALYFQNLYEYSFMDFLSARELYYSEADRWIYNIFTLKRLQTRKERVEF